MAGTAVTKEDVGVLLNTCAFARRIYVHYQALFEPGNPHRALFDAVAPFFFGDLKRVLIEYLILQVCKLADPENTRGNENLSVEFFINHSDFTRASAQMSRLQCLGEKIGQFARKLKQARDKYVSHFDRASILAGEPLGGADGDSWKEFWMDLKEFVYILSKHYLGRRFSINSGSDASQFVEVLRVAATLGGAREGSK